jgi:formylglycine-generating enzyme required for sulfatase activity
VKTVDANSFIGRIRAKTGLSIDLPTEAQWEYACRAGTTSSYYNNGGNAESDLSTLGRYDGNLNDGRGGYSEHTKVGSYAPNAWGLHDMHGNVYEWCLDWYGSLTNSSDPVGSVSGSYRVRRGGCWYYGADSCTSSYRDYDSPSDHNLYYGFRLACSAGL